MKNDDLKQKIIHSTKAGNLDYLKSQPKEILREAKCDVGCSILHWAAGLGFIAMVDFLLSKGTGDDDDDDDEEPIFETVDIQSESKLAKGRTPLFYAVRNGHLEMTKILIERYNANAMAQAKQGVTPFQLAVWQNRLDICQYLVDKCGVVPSNDINEFGCGAIHWLGIIPYHRANYESHGEDTRDSSNDQNGEGLSLMPLAKWIFAQPNIDMQAKQNQGHTVLHKAAWGGHLALIQYLHEIYDMYDDCIDCAGNYAADICDMINTKRHKAVALYLRSYCSLERLKSLEILGLKGEANLTHEIIRRAYLEKAKQHHPDVKSRIVEDNTCVTTADGNDQSIDFDQIRTAYEHLTSKGGISSKQKNPAHSINLLLEMQSKTDTEGNVTYDKEDSIDDDDLFKARLLAVLLDFGEKGMNLGNIPRRWDHIWPLSPLDSFFNGQKRKSGDLLKLIKKKAGDVVRIVQVKQFTNNNNHDKGSGKKGAIMVYPRDLSRQDVLSFASDQNSLI